MQLIGRYWSEYDFFNSSALPRELECRGFTEDFDMPGYLYREDGMKLWKAYGEFAGEFVDEIFRKPDKTIDQAIADDPEVQRWASEMASPGRAGIKGFPSPIPNKESLVECMQTIWWICSGLHAAVNFPQYDVSARVLLYVSAFIGNLREKLFSISASFTATFQTSLSVCARECRIMKIASADTPIIKTGSS